MSKVLCLVDAMKASSGPRGAGPVQEPVKHQRRTQHTFSQVVEEGHGVQMREGLILGDRIQKDRFGGK